MLKTMLLGRKIKSGVIFALLIVIGLFAVALFSPKSSSAQPTPTPTSSPGQAQNFTVTGSVKIINPHGVQLGISYIAFFFIDRPPAGSGEDITIFDSNGSNSFSFQMGAINGERIRFIAYVYLPDGVTGFMSNDQTVIFAGQNPLSLSEFIIDIPAPTATLTPTPGGPTNTPAPTPTPQPGCEGTYTCSLVSDNTCGPIGSCTAGQRRTGYDRCTSLKIGCNPYNSRDYCQADSSCGGGGPTNTPAPGCTSGAWEYCTYQGNPACRRCFDNGSGWGVCATQDYPEHCSIPTPTPPACPWDLSGDGTVDGADRDYLNVCYDPLGGIKTVPGKNCNLADLSSAKGVVNALDYSILLAHWGNCP